MESRFIPFLMLALYVVVYLTNAKPFAEFEARQRILKDMDKVVCLIYLILFFLISWKSLLIYALILTLFSGGVIRKKLENPERKSPRTRARKSWKYKINSDVFRCPSKMAVLQDHQHDLRWSELQCGLGDRCCARSLWQILHRFRGTNQRGTLCSRHSQLH